jgi:hypothetical protein
LAETGFFSSFELAAGSFHNLSHDHIRVPGPARRNSTGKNDQVTGVQAAIRCECLHRRRH